MIYTLVAIVFIVGAAPDEYIIADDLTGTECINNIEQLQPIMKVTLHCRIQGM